MAEIVEDLRKRADSAREAQHHYDHNPIMTDADIVAFCEAADTIEALQQRCEELERAQHERDTAECNWADRIAALEATLKEIRDGSFSGPTGGSAAQTIARQALTSSEGAGECTGCVRSTGGPFGSDGVVQARHDCPIHSPTSAGEGREDG